MNNIVFLVLFVLLAASTILGFVVHIRMLSRLKKGFPAVWNDLGAPSFLIGNHTMRTDMRFQRFLKNREFAQLPDRSLVRLCEVERISGRLHILLFALTVIVFLVMIWKK